MESISLQKSMEEKHQEIAKQQLQDYRQRLTSITASNVALKAVWQSQAKEQEDLYYSLQKRLDDRYSRASLVEKSKIHLDVDLGREEQQLMRSIASAESEHEASLVPVNSSLNEAEGDLRQVKHLRDIKAELTEKVAELEKVFAKERLAQITDIFERDKAFVRGKEDAQAGHMMASRHSKKVILKNAPQFLRKKKAETLAAGVQLDVSLENRSHVTWALLERCEKAVETNRALRNELELLDGTGEAIAARVREAAGLTTRLNRKVQRGLEDSRVEEAERSGLKTDTVVGVIIDQMTGRSLERGSLAADHFEVRDDVLRNRSTLEQLQLRFSGVMEARQELNKLHCQAMVVLLGCIADAKRAAKRNGQSFCLNDDDLEESTLSDRERRTEGRHAKKEGPRSWNNDYEWLLDEPIPPHIDAMTAPDLASFTRFLVQRMHDYRGLLKGEEVRGGRQQREEDSKALQGNGRTEVVNATRTTKDGNGDKDGTSLSERLGYSGSRGSTGARESFAPQNSTLPSDVESNASADSLLPPLSSPPPLLAARHGRQPDGAVSANAGRGQYLFTGPSTEPNGSRDSGFYSGRSNSTVGTARLSKVAQKSLRGLSSSQQLPRRSREPAAPNSKRPLQFPAKGVPSQIPTDLIVAPRRLGYYLSGPASTNKGHV